LKVLAIIPARKGSKRLKGKNIKNLCGKPLIAHTFEHAKKSKYINDIVVTSDSREIKEIASKYKIKYLTRPKTLCDDKSSSESALVHALDECEKSRGKYDLVVFLQCTSPIRRKNEIDNAIDFFLKNKADSLFSCFEDVSFFWEKKGKKIKSFNYDYNNRKREQDFEPYLNENGSIYIFKPQILKKHNNRLGGSIVAYKMPEWASFQIDHEEDFEVISSIMKNKLFIKRIME